MWHGKLATISWPPRPGETRCAVRSVEKNALRKGGEFRLVGGPPGEHPVTFAAWIYKAITMHAIHGRRLWGDWVLGQDLLAAGKVDLSPLVSHVLPLSESASGFELILAGEALKPILVPD